MVACLFLVAGVSYDATTIPSHLIAVLRCRSCRKESGVIMGMRRAKCHWCLRALVETVGYIA